MVDQTLINISINHSVNINKIFLCIRMSSRDPSKHYWLLRPERVRGVGLLRPEVRERGDRRLPVQLRRRIPATGRHQGYRQSINRSFNQLINFFNQICTSEEVWIWKFKNKKCM